MRTLLFICIFGTLHAQDSLPPNNALVLQFVNDHRGQKIGVGVCEELIFEAWTYVDSANGYRDSVMDAVPLLEIMPGDILDLRNVVFADGSVVESHSAIIYNITTFGTISIAQQNAGSLRGGEKVMYKGEKIRVVKDSRVEISIFEPSTIVSGKVTFYRL